MTGGGRGQHARKPPIPFGTLLLILALLTAGVVVWRMASRNGSGGGGARTAPASSTPPGATSGVASTSPSPPASPAGTPTPGPINTKFPGLTTFRGNASRSYYGEGPVPRHPKVLWRYPTSGGLCSSSSALGQTKEWCGTGWTGQPNVIQHQNGTVEVREGAYDGHYHFLDGRTGRPLRADLVTGDLAKGSASSDPSGYPLYYAGSRDNLFRVVAMDRHRPTVLWSMDANATVPHPLWNDDWDGAALVVGDYLLEGGENSWFYVVKLNRRYDAKGKVTVNPRIVVTVPGYDQRLLRTIGDQDVSIENSVAFRDGIVYFSNSGGLVQGWDISDVLAGGSHVERVFRFWSGDDVDASVVIDEQGYLYVARHVEENVSRTESAARDRQIGSLMKLDPHDAKHPVVWSVHLGSTAPDGGILSTPALYNGVVYVAPTDGELVAVDQQSGRRLWRIHLPGPTWSSPVPIDGVLLQGDCSGALHAYDISNPRRKPPERWRVHLGGCIESTPAVWHGMIYVGTRSGGIYGIGDKAANA